MKKHPDCYIQSFINNTYAYFYPTNNRWYIYFNERKTLNEIGNFNYHYNSLNNVRKVLIAYGKSFRNIPIVGLLSNIGFNSCLTIIYVVYFAINKEKKKYIIMLLPSIVTILVCLASPVNNYFRYAMPVIFTMPITTIFFIKEINKKENENGKK